MATAEKLNPQRAKFERQMNLAMALYDARNRGKRMVSSSWIRDRIPGYATSSSGRRSTDAIRKMIDRDIEDLNRVGIGVGTKKKGNENHYFVAPAEATLSEVSFTREEKQLVAMAGNAGTPGEISAFSQSGWTKFVAAGEDIPSAQTDVTMKYYGDVESLSGKDTEALVRARQKHQCVRFLYQPHRYAEKKKRAIEPWGIRPHNDRLYCIGWDLTACASRVYRLSNISEVEIVTRPCNQSVPSDDELCELLSATLNSFDTIVTARFRVNDCSRTDLDIIADSTDLGGGYYECSHLPRRVLIDTALELAPDIVITEPEDIREEIITQLRAVVFSHKLQEEG